MSLLTWCKVAAVVVAVGAASTTGVVAFAPQGVPEGKTAGDTAKARPNPSGPRRSERPEIVAATRASFRVDIGERGSLEASAATDLASQVQGVTHIMSILPEGTRVKAGEVICELDSAQLRERASDQLVAMKTAEAALQNARAVREVAEIAIVEYADGQAKSEQEALLGQINLAKSALTAAEARLQRTKAARERLVKLMGPNHATSPSEVAIVLDIQDREDEAVQGIARAQFDLEGTQSRLKTHELTRKKTLKSLQVGVEQARANEFGKQALYDLERTRFEKIQRQVECCRIVAPTNGTVVYANDPNRMNGQFQGRIAQGAAVRDGQKILTLTDLERPMRVRTRIKEAVVDQIKPGQKVRVTVDFVPGKELHGVVEEVAPLPDPPTQDRMPGMGGPPIKVYTTLIRIEDGPPELRPGMTAHVDITVDERPDAVTIPVAAVTTIAGKYHVTVELPDGSFAWRRVELGVSDQTRIEVKSGLEAGDRVLLNPPVASEKNRDR